MIDLFYLKKNDYYYYNDYLKIKVKYLNNYKYIYDIIE